MNSKKILIMGLPGSGKTTLAKLLKDRLNAVHFNADEIRQNINKDLGFSLNDRIEQARRMGFLCDCVVKAGHYVIADFICPTVETREAFGIKNSTLIWINRIDKSRFKDTNMMFEPPEQCDLLLTDGTPEEWAKKVMCLLSEQLPSAFLLGRFQPFHAGHKALAVESINRVGRVVIGVRNTVGTDSKNPFTFDTIKKTIDDNMIEYVGKYEVLLLPNITNIYYGRDVGYKIEKLEMGEEIEKISATNIRKQLGA